MNSVVERCHCSRCWAPEPAPEVQLGAPPSILSVLGPDLLAQVLRRAAEGQRQNHFNPSRVWFLVAVCRHLRLLVAQILPDRLPLEVYAHRAPLATFQHNLFRSLPYFAITKLVVHIELRDARREQYDFAFALGRCTRLAELQLRTALSPGLMQALRSVGHLETLTTLNLWPRSMSEAEQMIGFVIMCAQMSNLTSLAIWEATFTDGDMLGQALQQLPRLRSLRFHDMRISATGLRNAVVAALPGLSTLTHLHLGLLFELKEEERPDAAVAASMTEEVFETLVRLTALQQLELTNLDTMGQTPPFYALSALTALRELSMRGCEFLDDAAHQLAVVLPACTSLRRLNLSFNQIELDGVYSLVQALPQCTHLRQLDLSDNSFRAVPPELLEHIHAADTHVDYGWVATPEYSPRGETAAEPQDAV